MRIHAQILYKPTTDNPDNQYTYVGELIDGRQEFSDTYYIDRDRFSEVSHIITDIVQDLKTVASGGYDSDKVYDTIFKIQYLCYELVFTDYNDMYKVLARYGLE